MLQEFRKHRLTYVFFKWGFACAISYWAFVRILDIGGTLLSSLDI